MDSGSLQLAVTATSRCDAAFSPLLFILLSFPLSLSSFLLFSSFSPSLSFLFPPSLPEAASVPASNTQSHTLEAKH